MSRQAYRIGQIEKMSGGAKKERLDAQLRFVHQMSLVQEHRWDDMIGQALDHLEECFRRHGMISDSAVTEAERLLMPCSEECKAYTLLFAGHAHIDMNWMWRYDETVSITLDTFRTALDLMDEFPDFTFSQSQASVYEIVEKHEPELLEEIRGRIASGQWEVTASTWVEADRNMPAAESVARQQLYTRRYLPKLLGVKEEKLCLDFEPDTFGHSANTPEMLSRAGVKWYYHCRGEESALLYRWRAPSGAEVLTYREPNWYLGPVDGTAADFVPAFCAQTGMHTALRVYGVGDHGGGPTRRDVLTIRDMMRWPIFPTVRFGTLAMFYEEAEKRYDTLPVIERERNFVFTGCYTSQSEIKKGNFIAENMLTGSEALSVFAHHAAGSRYDRAKFEQAWRKVLFNQFHDILPGSGVNGTRDYALGLYQDVYASAESARRSAMKSVAAKIDTSIFREETSPSARSQGAGVGFGIEEHRTALVERGGGSTRIWHLFNPLPIARKENVELIAWDLLGDIMSLRAFADGKEISVQILDRGRNEYWQHDYTRLLVQADIPALGYSTIVLKLCEDADDDLAKRDDPRVFEPMDPILENEILCAQFSPSTGELISLTDKRSGKCVACGGGFRNALESPELGMTSWTTGRLIAESRLTAERMEMIENGPLRKALKMRLTGEGCAIDCTISLGQDDDALVYDVTCDWQRAGSEVNGIPRLDWAAQITEPTRVWRCSVPGGMIVRESAEMDMPCTGVACAGGFALETFGKYGIRTGREQIRAALLRSSFDPDPFPELGRHSFRFCVRAVQESDHALLQDHALRANPPLPVSNTAHEGILPLKHSFISQLSGEMCTQAVKLAEDGDAICIRGTETSGTGHYVEYRFDVPPKTAAFVNTMEQLIAGDVRIMDTRVRAYIPANAMYTLKIHL